MVAGQVMLAISLVFGLVFVLMLGKPWRNEYPTMAWLQASLAWVAVGFDAWLLLASFGVHADLLVFSVLILQDLVFAWRLWVLITIRRGAYHGGSVPPE